MKLVASNVTVVVLPYTGHWVLEERPKETTDALVKFLQRIKRRSMFTKVAVTGTLVFALNAQSLPQMRLPPSEIRGRALDSNQVGSSGLACVHIKVLSAIRAKQASNRFCCSCPPTGRFKRALSP
jgi:hypothetical protein